MIWKPRDLIFPPRCPMCDEVLGLEEDKICNACLGLLPFIKEPTCMKCGKQLDDKEEEYCQDCSRRVKHFVRGYPLFNYIEPVSSSLQRFKYGGREEYAEYYGRALREHAGEHLIKNGVQALVPVPIHKRRYITRGYNQAELIARALSEETGIPVRTDMIIRTENTKPQKDLDDLAREENLARAFAPGRMNSVIPECVCIVDDIYTTGSTIEACTNVVMAAGAKRVYYVSVAIGRV